MSQASVLNVSIAGQFDQVDVLTVDTSGGPLAVPISFNGQGGLGTDILELDLASSGVTLDLVGDIALNSVEMVDIRGSGANVARMNRDSVVANVGLGQAFLVRGNVGDAIHIEPTWTPVGTTSLSGVTYDVFELDGAKLHVEQGDDASQFGGGIGVS